MKNIKYTKEDCIICNNIGDIIVLDKPGSKHGEIVSCPLCEAKGYLNILKKEETK